MVLLLWVDGQFNFRTNDLALLSDLFPYNHELSLWVFYQNIGLVWNRSVAIVRKKERRKDKRK